MNFRVLTLKYMGWCPGVESAARFIPDRDIPPIRIVFSFFIIASVSASSFLLSREALVYLGFPSDPSVRYMTVRITSTTLEGIADPSSFPPSPDPPNFTYTRQ